jgi:hypothetical protein
LTTNMRDKLNTFISNTIGHFQEVSYSPALYQCMDLVYEWAFTLGFPKSSIQHQYAYQVFTEATDTTRQYFDLFLNTKEFIPQAGDIVVWNKTSSNVAGHIGIVIEATLTRMKVYDQNKPLGTNANISDETYTNVIGFLRPKVSPESVIPQWLLTLLQERGLTLRNEAEIRSLFDKAKKYDDDIKVLQEQVKTANESLADRSIEVSNLISKVQSFTGKVEELENLYNTAKSERDNFETEMGRLSIANKDLTERLDTTFKELEGLKVNYSELQAQKIQDFRAWTLISLGIKKLFGR